MPKQTGLSASLGPTRKSLSPGPGPFVRRQVTGGSALRFDVVTEDSPGGFMFRREQLKNSKKKKKWRRNSGTVLQIFVGCVAASRGPGSTKGLRATGPRDQRDPRPDRPALSVLRSLSSPGAPDRWAPTLRGVHARQSGFRPPAHPCTLSPRRSSRDPAGHGGRSPWQDRPFPVSSLPPKPPASSPPSPHPAEQERFLVHSEPLTDLMSQGPVGPALQ